MDWLLAESSAAPMDGQSTWLIYGVVAMGLMYLVLRPMLKRKDPLSRLPAKSSLSQQRSLERQMEQLLVELAEMSRQMTAQLDTRSAKLQALLDEADRKITALGDERGRDAAVSTRAASASDIRHGSDSEEPPDPRHAEIYTLADQGCGPHEIAAQLNRPHGEVELILALRRQE